MNEEQQLEALNDMFASDGWKILVADLTNSLRTYTLDACNTSDEFFVAKGKAQMLHMIINYDQLVNLNDHVADT